MAEAAQAGMAMYNFDLFSYYNIPKYRKEGKDRRHSRFSVDDEERNMIDLEAIGEVVNSRASLICMSDNDDFVSPVNELLGASQPRGNVETINETDCG